MTSPTDVLGRPAPPGVPGRMLSMTIGPRTTHAHLSGVAGDLQWARARVSSTVPRVPSGAMKALRSFTVRPTLPAALAAPRASGHEPALVVGPPTRELFRWVDPEEWDAVVHDPVRLLGNVEPQPARGTAGRQGLHAVPRLGLPRPRRLPRARRRGSRAERTARCAPSPTSPPSSGSPRPCPSTPAVWACWPATTSRRPATWASRWSPSG